MNFDDVRNRIEREAEAKFPGYKGPVWGEFTPAPEFVELPRRTQVAFADGAAYWLDVPEGSVLVGDMVAIAERGIELWGISASCRAADRPKVTVEHIGMTLPSEYFEKKNAIHRFGTFVELIRRV